MNSSITLALALTAPLTAHAALYVSPEGSDQQDGTKQAPYATIAHALEQSVERNESEIVLLDGTYHLEQPLTLTARHSGTSQQPRAIRAANPGRVILSAGTPLVVNWSPGNNGTFTATVPETVDLTTGCDALFIDSQSPRLARFPNYNPKARWLKGASAESFSAERIRSWADPTGGIVHAMHPAHWGGNHWTITGKKSDTECHLEGGWMNNRGGGIHPTDRFVENIIEELDAPDEWFLDHKTRTLHFMPRGEFAAGKGTIILSRNECCVQVSGSADAPVQHLTIDGVSFRHTARTFMKTKEPLLRSDWKIYRGGAIFTQGAKNLVIENCEFTQLGGNAYFASGINRGLRVSGSHFHHIGASAICFVGDTSAVHNPLFNPYGPPTPWDQVNKKDRGPKTQNYPTNCVAEDCLIHDIGQVEKQVAGLQISVAHKITGRHLSIYDVPRAGINIGENAFGGHLIEGCDVFDTVQESADHGSFNSWGRDRFWHTNYGAVNQQVAEHPELPLIDMMDQNIIRDSRWRCDHGWDIDLDDGSSGYLVENNLCLGGGIKLREGYHRIVRNNLVVANTFHPHVWFNQSEDVITHNIWATPVENIQLTGKGKLWDKNIHMTQVGLAQARAFGVDAQGIQANIKFASPEDLDFTFPMTDAIHATGFTLFDQSNYGVQKPALKKIARTPAPPEQSLAPAEGAVRRHQLLDATMKAVSTLGEVSATGLPDQRGVLILNINHGGKADSMRLKPNDVIREVNGKPVSNCEELLQAWAHAKAPVKMTVWRTQQGMELGAPSFPGVILSAASARIDGGAVFDKPKNYIGRWTDQNATLTWDADLKPNTRYRVLIDQAAAGKKPNQWALSGMATPVTGTTKQTADWESFVPILHDDPTLSKQAGPHTLTIRPKVMESALMNVREVILIED